MPPSPNAPANDAHASQPSPPCPSALLAAGVVLLALAWGGVRLWPQMAMAPSALPPSLAVHEDRRSPPLTTQTPTALRLSSVGPEWKELTPVQRDILQPLHLQWPAMGGLTKRRWLLLAQLYPNMDAKEQAKLHERMQSWASLSAQQRNQARLNFSNVKRLTPAELAAKWEEYQALSQAEKQRLADEARAAQQAVKAIRKKRKLTRVPAAASAPAAANPPKILPPASMVPALPAPPPAMPAPVDANAQAPAPAHVIAAPVTTHSAAPAQPLPSITEAAPLPVQVPQPMHTMDLPPLPHGAPATSTTTDAASRTMVAPAPAPAPAPEVPTPDNAPHPHPALPHTP